MGKVVFRWKTRNVDIVLKWVKFYWITGFNARFESTATVETVEQERMIEKLEQEGLIEIVSRDEGS